MLTLAWWGIGFLISGLWGFMSAERGVGLFHFFDVDWIFNDRLKELGLNSVVSGQVATVCKIINRVLVLIGVVLCFVAILIGVVT